MDERKYIILRAIIDDYILTAMPVGSRTISRKEGIGLSSATIRNEMSDLEEMGFLDQPHTSAGRVPSWKAYRWYADQMMRVTGLPPEDIARIRSIFSHRMQQMEEIVSSTASAISEMTSYTAVVMQSQEAERRLRRAQLVRITDERALLVLVMESGATHEAMVPIPRDCPDDHLYMLSSQITRHIAGCGAAELNGAFREMTEEMAGQRQFFDIIAHVAADATGKQNPPHIALGGASQLLKYPEYADIEKARMVLGALETKEQLAKVLASRAGMEFSISIGPEIDIEGMEDCSLVTVAYRMGGERSGTMGVIGPTRMHYARVLSVLDGMRKALNTIFYNEEDS